MPKVLSSLYVRSPSAAPVLRVGVLLDSLTLPRAFAAVIEDIRASNFASLVVAVTNGEGHREEAAPRSLAQKVLRTVADPYRRRHVLFSAYESLIEPRMRYADDPLEEVEIGSLLGEVPVLEVKPISSRFVHRFPPEALQALKALNLDVLIRFGFNVLRGDILTVARYGVWSYHHGDNAVYRGLPPAFWEMAEGNPVTGVVLQKLTEELDAGTTLAQAHFSTHSVFSMARNRFGPYWGSVHFVIQKLFEVHRDGWDAVTARSLPTPAYRGKRSLYRRPTNQDVVTWAARRVAPALMSRLFKRKVESWKLGLRRAARPLFERGAVPEEEMIWLVGPKDHFWADPCLIEQGGATHLFFEDFDYRTHRGVVGYGRVESDGRLSDVHTVLTRPYHLSYPLVFSHQGEVFMVPETSEAGVVELYRARRFPDEWVRVKTLLDLPGLDSTPFFHNGRWWLFTSPLLGQHHAPITLLFSAADLEGPFEQHPASPVSTDVRVARSAGSIIQEADRLIRVSQDCGATYGARVVFSQITALDWAHYAEAPVCELLPISGHTGMHTYSRAGGWEVIDARYRAPKREICSR